MRYSVRARGEPEEAMLEVTQYFGPEGIGLEVEDRGAEGIRFTGGGGFVEVRLEGERPTVLELTTQEYDYDVQCFMRRIS